MKLYKNGFVVAKITDMENFSYKAWPLFGLTDDKVALTMTDEAYNNWFAKYEMQHIVPDPDYIGTQIRGWKNCPKEIRRLSLSFFKGGKVNENKIKHVILGFI